MIINDLCEKMPELDINWIVDLRHRMKFHYENLENFATSNNLNYLDCFWFFKGNPVVESSFKAICNVLDCDWEKVQTSPLTTNKTMDNYPQPDPSWIYYPLWQHITAAHTAIEEAMKYMTSEECENPNLATDNVLDHIIDKAHCAIIQAGESWTTLRKDQPQEELN